MDHVGVNVDDLDAAVAFFEEIGLSLEGRATNEGAWVDRIIGLNGSKADIAMMRLPDGPGGLELVKFHSPAQPDGSPSAPANATGIRHVTFLVEDVNDVVARLCEKHGAELVGTIEDYENIYRLCYIRGPEGIIVELTQELG